MSADLDSPALLDDYIIELTNKHGIEYVPAVLPKDLWRGKLGHCFDNAFLQAVRNPKYRYVEGITTVYNHGKITTAVHAWLTDGLYAYDPTWVAYGYNNREVALPALYRGIELDLDTVTRFILATGRQGVITNRDLKPQLYKQVLKATGI